MNNDTPSSRALFACVTSGQFARQTLRAAALLPVLGMSALFAAETPATTAPAAAPAEAPARKAGDTAVALDPVVVVASRTPERLSEVSPSVSYIGQEELIPAGRYTLSDSLREEQGVYIASYGANGATASIFSRGADSRMTQITLDGRRLNPGFSNFDTSTLLLDNLSSVQLMRGATSTLYGANAMAGVIDLRSTDPFELDRPVATLSGEGGSYGYWRTGFQVAGTARQVGLSDDADDTGFGFSLGGSWMETDNKRGNNHYRMANILPRVDYKVSDALSFNTIIRYYDYDMGLPGDNTVPGGYNPYSSQTGSNWIVSPGVKVKLNEQIELEAYYSYTRNTLDSITSDWQSWVTPPAWSTPFPSYSTAEGHEATIMATWQINEIFAVSGGYTFEKKIYDKPADFNYTFTDYHERMDSNSPWLQVRATPVEDLKIAAGVRFNQFSDYDDAWTGEAQISYRIAASDTTLHARVANAYATPDVGTLAYGYSSTGLKPEKNIAWEIGAKQALDVLRGGTIGVVYFENYFTDLIQWDFMTSTGYNIDKATTRGWELSGEVRLIDQVRLYANTTFLRTENKQTGRRLVRRPDWTGTIGVEAFPVETLTVGFSVTYVHGVEDIDAATYAQVDNKNYTYGRVYANWRFWEHAELFGRIENLFDQNYWTANGYPALPINAYAGVRLSF